MTSKRFLSEMLFCVLKEGKRRLTKCLKEGMFTGPDHCEDGGFFELLIDEHHNRNTQPLPLDDCLCPVLNL